MALGKTYNFTAPPPSGLVAGGTSHAKTVIAAFGDLGRGTTDDSDLWHEYGSPAVATSARLKGEVDNGTVHAVYHIGREGEGRP